MYITWQIVRENTLPCTVVSQTGCRVKCTNMALYRAFSKTYIYIWQPLWRNYKANDGKTA